MKKLISLLLCCLVLYVGICSVQANKKVNVNRTESLHSKILNEERKIWVYVPATNDLNRVFPVVYVLDGDNQFGSVKAMVQYLSETQRNTILPQMILIGIQNIDRMRDFNGETFTSFIEKELIPYVDSVYPSSEYRVLIGHSLGGAYTVNTLLNHIQLFKSYIAIDPMSIDNHKLLEQANKVFKEKDFTGNSFYITMANSPAVSFDDTSTGNYYRANLRLINYIEANKQNNLKFAWKYYKDDNHTSVPFISEYDGLRFIFSFYKFPEIDILLKTSNPDSIITNHYQNVSRILGYQVSPPEGELLSLGYVLIDNKLYDKSYVILKMLIDKYPQNFMFYNAMGDLYRSKGDTLKAIEYYEKTLSFNPNDGMAKQMIKDLKGKSKDKSNNQK